MSGVPQNIGDRLAHVEAMKPVIAARKSAREAAAAAPAERRRREAAQRRRDGASAAQVRAYVEREPEPSALLSMRGALGLSQSRMAELVGVARHTYRRAERGAPTQPRTRWTIALGLSRILPGRQLITPRQLWPKDNA